MSSGYSSLEEDAEDFFFTARTSFFRRAPQGKPRAGQQVSGVPGRRCSRRSVAPAESRRGGTPKSTGLRGARGGCSRGRRRRRRPPRRGFCLSGCRGSALSLCVRACAGRPGEGSRREAGGRAGRRRARSRLPRQMASVALPPAAGGWGAVLRARRCPPATPRFSPAPGDALRPLAGLTPAPTISPFPGLWPLEWLGGRVTARSGCGDLASPTFPVQAPLVAGSVGER